MKKGDKLLVSWSTMYGHAGAGWREVLRTRRRRSYATGKTFLEVRIREPQGPVVVARC
jgi:hypothetical protein